MAGNTRPSGVAIEFFKRGEMAAFRYVSGTTVREEALDDGRFIGLYWSASGQAERMTGPGRSPASLRSYYPDPLVYPLDAFELQIDGQLLNSAWDLQRSYERTGGRPGTVEAVVELKHQVRPVTINVVTRLDGTPILMRWLEITNTGAGPAALSHVSSWAGALWRPLRGWNPSRRTDEPAYSLGYLKSEQRSEEGDFQWVDLPRETYRIDRAQGTNYGPPYFIVRNNITGEVFFIALAWSRNWFAEFMYKDCLTRQNMGLGDEWVTLLSTRAAPLGPAPLRVIAPGETISSPELHIGPVHAGLDVAVQAWQQHMRASVVPPRPAGREMFTMTGRVVEYPGDWLLREIDAARDMGIEAFIVDAGWYGDEFANWPERRGDWYAGNWLPGGSLDRVRDHIHQQGMLFGLWIEPEQVGRMSRVLAEHPDWVLKTAAGRAVGAGHTQPLDLANPHAARFVEESVVRCVRDYKVDILKIDYNTRVYEGGQSRREGYIEQESWRHCEVIYRLFDRIRREFPNVILETCAGGGGRNDIAMLSRFHYGCESDFSWFPRNIRAINGLGMFLPPESICYYHNHIGHDHQTADIDTQMRVTLFANTVFVGFGDQNTDHNTAFFQATKRYIRLAKDFCYPIMKQPARVYHHTPGIGVSTPAQWCVLEYASPDRTRAYAGVFALDAAHGDGDCYVFRPRGLDMALDYDVTLDNEQQVMRAPGRQLVRDGILVRLDATLTSQLLLFQARDAAR